jgi:hypothetical protein
MTSRIHDSPSLKRVRSGALDEGVPILAVRSTQVPRAGHGREGLPGSGRGSDSPAIALLPYDAALNRIEVYR